MNTQKFNSLGVQLYVYRIVRFDVQTNAPIGVGTVCYGLNDEGGCYTETGHYIFPNQIGKEILLEELTNESN